MSKLSRVGQWIGRNTALDPVLLVASPCVTNPKLEDIPEWSYNPFMGKRDEEYVYGRGAQGAKLAMVAMMAAWDSLVQAQKVPDRSIYFVFPHSEDEEKLILKALTEAPQKPQFVLKTGGFVAKDLLWDIPSPIAFIGIVNPSSARFRLQLKGPKQQLILQEFMTNLKERLPAVDIENPVLQHLIYDLSPATGFSDRLLLSNGWLLKSLYLMF